MGPYEAKALMRFNATDVFYRLSAKADTLIDMATSLNFVSKEFVVANGFYEYCKTAPRLAIRVASEQRISTTKMFVLQILLLMGTSSLICNLEFFLTLEVRILY